LGTEKASPKPGEAFLSGGNAPNKENRVNILLVNHINQLQNTEIIHFQHCEIKIIRIFAISLLVKQHC